MIYHVLPGDSLVEEFRKAYIDGEVIVCSEALIAGPIDAPTLDEFWDDRARFVLAEYGDDEIEYHEKVAANLNRLTEMTAEDEVNLWFEYELFCSVNYWFCLSLLAETNAAVCRVEPLGLEPENRWDGFGNFDDGRLKAAFDNRKLLTSEDVDLGRDLWNAYRQSVSPNLTGLAEKPRDAFPYLKEVAAAAIEQTTKPLEILREITANGETDFTKIFTEFKKRAGVYGYGDLQVQRLLDSGLPSLQRRGGSRLG